MITGWQMPAVQSKVERSFLFMKGRNGLCEKRTSEWLNPESDFILLAIADLNPFVRIGIDKMTGIACEGERLGATDSFRCHAESSIILTQRRAVTITG
jgi:hypothetical protein